MQDIQEGLGKMGKRKSRTIQICIASILFMLCGMIALSVWRYYSAEKEAVETVHMHAEAISQSLNNMTVRKDFDEINSSEDMDKEVYQMLRNLLSIVRVSSDVQYLYTVKRNETGQYIYLVDGMEPDDQQFCVPGELFETEYKEDLDMAYSGTTVIANKIMDSPWGKTITAFYPLRDEASQDVYGVLGITFNMESAVVNLQGVVRMGFFSCFLIFLVGAVLVVFLGKEKNNLQQLRVLEADAKEKEKQLQFERMQYKDVIIHNCNEAIAIDVTKGILERENIIKSSETIQRLNLTYPIEFNRFVKAWDKETESGLPTESWLSRENLLRAYQNGNTLQELEYYLKKDHKYYGTRALLIKNEMNGHIHASIFSYDITERKRREQESKIQLETALAEAEKANAAKTEFLSRISHDIRTPLTAIIGMAELVSRYRNDQERVDDYMNKIRISGEHLLALINEVLDMRKIEDGVNVVHEERLELMKIIENVILINREQLDVHSHELQVAADSLVHPYIYADQFQLQQIFVNLLNNAVKYTPDGGKLKIDVHEITSLDEDYSKYEISFQDNGVGMSQEFAARIFEPFSREEGNGDHKAAGNGLGMTIVKKAVEKMEGDIRVDSSEGEGTVITVSFVFKHTADVQNQTEVEDERKSSRKETHKQGKFNDMKVLLVDDQDFNREIAKEFIELLGADVDEAVNGREALDILTNSEEGYYDIVFMDIQMPVMDGYTATKEIRQSHRPDLQKLPIVAMTANAFYSDVEQAFAIGMNAHMSKPIDINRIGNVMEKFVSEKEG